MHCSRHIITIKSLHLLSFQLTSIKAIWKDNISDKMPVFLFQRFYSLGINLNQLLTERAGR